MGAILPQGIAKTISTPSGRAEKDKQYTLADVDPVGRTEVLIYGPPKSGKTVFASTFPPPFRWLAADGETCLKSLHWAYKNGLSAIKDPRADLVAYTPSEDIDKGVYPEHAMAFNKMTDMIDFWFSPEEVDKWKTLVIDSFTEVNEWALNHGLGLNNILPKPERSLSDSHKINLKAKLRIVTGQQDYKSAMGLIDGFITDVRLACAKHDKNLVIICHEWTESREDDDGVTQIVRYAPLMIGQLRQRVGKAFDDIWYMETYNKGGAPEIKVRVHGDAKHIAGTRFGLVLKSEEEPDFRKILAKVRAGGDGAKSAPSK